MDRRDFLRNAVIAGAGLTIAPELLGACSSESTPRSPSTAPPTTRPPSSVTTTSSPRAVTGPFRAGNPYGPLRAPDANGIRLPAHFTSRIVAVSDEVVEGTEYTWHPSPDGGACFPARDGSRDYVYVSNAETTTEAGAGASAIRFSSAGRVLDSYRILGGTQINCAGGATPWGTWLSGEEFDEGRIWECDPFRASQGTARAALGWFAHEAAAVDAVGKRIYLTEDRPDGRLYRFTPSAYPNLSRGLLEVARVADPTIADAPVEWIRVSDGADGAHKPRPVGSTGFNGGEGICWHDGAVFFTTKGDNRVWKLDTERQLLTVLYDDDLVGDAPLHGVDNVTIGQSGELLVAEDGDNMQLVVLGADGIVGPLLQVVGQDESELTGPAFAPGGDRLYCSSQRARGADGLRGIGVTYEISGPFHEP